MPGTARRSSLTRSEGHGESDPGVTRVEIVASIVTVFSLAVTAPLFDLLRNNPEFFVARASPGIDIAVFAILVAVLAPAALVLIVVVLPKRIRQVVFAVLFGSISALLVIQVVDALAVFSSSPVWFHFLLGVGGGVAAVIAVRRFHTVRSFMRVGVVLPIALVALFLFSLSSVLGGENDIAVVDTSVDDPIPIVVLVFDELPLTSLIRTNGSLNEERFPNFARLAEHTTWFRNAFANSPTTTLSVPSILTGVYPEERVPPVVSAHPNNLFTLLGGSYDVVGEESITSLCPASVCSPRTSPWRERWRVLWSDVSYVTLHVLLPGPMTESIAPIDGEWMGFGPDGQASPSVELPSGGVAPDSVTAALLGDRLGSFREWLERMTSMRDSTAYFHHSLIPHGPWTYVSTGQRYQAIARLPGIASNVWGDQQWLVDQAYQRHLYQVGLADRLLGDVLDQLERSDMLGRAMIVVTADHGITFETDAPKRGAIGDNLGTLGAVPLFVSLGGPSDGSTVDETVELVDILPTIVERLGADIEWEFDGVSLFETVAGNVGSARAVVTFPENQRHEDPGEQRINATTEIAKRYDVDGGWDDVLGGEAGWGIVGESVESQRMGTPLTWTVEVRRLNEFEDVDLDGPTLPVMVEGHVVDWGASVPPGHIAVALNGTITAVTETFDQAGPDMISAVVRPQDLQDGSNSLELFGVEIATDGSQTLRPVETVTAGS